MIQINILGFELSRIPFLKKSLAELYKIKNKDKINVLISYSPFYEEYEIICNDLNSNGIKCDTIRIDGAGNYLNKIRYFANNTNSEYSCSMDEDIFLSSYAWYYMIDNINILNNDENFLLVPMISNGIPTVEMFIEDFCSQEVKEQLYNIFKHTHIPNRAGVDYSRLNYNKDVWDSEKFYSEVYLIDHYYKGMHPIRISYEANFLLAETIIQNYSKFVSDQNFKIDIKKRPYFCNSFYFIKTEEWKNLINDKTIFNDGYDEIIINGYMSNNKLNMCFVRNAYCLHMVYNTVKNSEKIQNYYAENFLNYS